MYSWLKAFNTGHPGLIKAVNTCISGWLKAFNTGLPVNTCIPGWLKAFNTGLPGLIKAVNTCILAQSFQHRSV